MYKNKTIRLHLVDRGVAVPPGIQPVRLSELNLRHKASRTEQDDTTKF